MRSVFTAAAMACATVWPMTNLHAEELTIERIYDAPALAGKTPMSLKVSPDGSRVTFLRGKDTDQYQLDLWEYDIASKETRMLVDSKVLLPEEEQLSDEEKAKRERARTASLKGIIEYGFSPDGAKLLFPLNGELFLYDLGADETQQAGRVRKLTHKELGFATDARVSPKGGFVSFVRNQNLWLIELATDRSIQLTRDGGGLVSNGVAEFIAQEEMGRFDGYWWAPDDSMIAFARVDETPVPVQRRFEINAEDTSVVEQRYPAAGQPNAAVRLGVIRIADAAPAEVANTGAGSALLPAEVKIRWVDLGEDRDIYLARAEWFADSSALSFQVQTRNQRRLDLRAWSVRDQSISTLLSESSQTWVNLHDDLQFLDSGDFVWASERDGFKRLYLHGRDGALKHALTPEAWVVDNLLAIDERNDRLFFASGGPDPTQKHVYMTPLSLPVKEVAQITHEAGMHNASFPKQANVFVASHSDPATPPRVRLFDAAGVELAVLEANELKEGHPYWPYAAEHSVPEFGEITGAEGQKLRYRVFKPAGFDAAHQYPVVVHIYGGPHGQMVTQSWTDPFLQVLTRKGFVVFQLDNRGMYRRGKAFEEALFRHMGSVEVVDQREGVKWLRAQPWVAGDKIGFYGWSYGGYMALQVLGQASDDFAAVVAGAPVTDWALYDTHYTERYMDHPKDNAEGYAQSSVFAHLDGMRSDLLLIHGMADDNVLFTNSTRLMSALQQRGKAFELMTYPGGKHGIAAPWMKKHANNAIVDFFERKLK
ncbi:MAG: S9 family peptidase [Xanthomonadales bacterium]|nr:S9 family peptidase [Xanthomonadales bacterium]